MCVREGDERKNERERTSVSLGMRASATRKGREMSLRNEAKRVPRSLHAHANSSMSWQRSTSSTACICGEERDREGKREKLIKLEENRDMSALPFVLRQSSSLTLTRPSHPLPFSLPLSYSPGCGASSSPPSTGGRRFAPSPAPPSPSSHASRPRPPSMPCTLSAHP